MYPATLPSAAWTDGWVGSFWGHPAQEACRVQLRLSLRPPLCQHGHGRRTLHRCTTGATTTNQDWDCRWTGLIETNNTTLPVRACVR